MRDLVQVFFNRRMAVMLLLGFSAGIPLGLTGGTLQAWMTEANVSLAIIGLASLVGAPYTLKFLWAPIMDRFSFPFLGRRRGWMLVTQVLLLAVIALTAFWVPPPADAELAFPTWMNWLIELEKTAGPILKNLVLWPLKFLFSLPLLFQFFFLPFLIAFFSASQDIVIDAYRTEVMPEEERGMSAGLYIMGYRLAMLLSGAGALILADQMAWKDVYLIMSLAMGVGIITTFFAPEPKVNVTPPRTLGEAVVEPFVEYFKRPAAYQILLFVLLFKLGDVMTGNLSTAFMIKLGFTKTDIGAVNKGLGLIMTIAGGLVGGALMARLGILKSLWIFGTLQAISNLSFSVLAMAGLNYPVMVFAIGFENLSGGMGTAAYVAFLMGVCNQRFTATQYALLTSLMAFARVFLGASSGVLAEGLGWVNYFLLCTALAVPGMLMLLRAKHWLTPSGESLPKIQA